MTQWKEGPLTSPWGHSTGARLPPSLLDTTSKWFSKLSLHQAQASHSLLELALNVSISHLLPPCPAGDQPHLHTQFCTQHWSSPCFSATSPHVHIAPCPQSPSISSILGIPTARPQVRSPTSASHGYFRQMCEAGLPGFQFFPFPVSFPQLLPYPSQHEGLTMSPCSKGSQLPLK